MYGYDSQRFDAASGLYDLRARSYDPATGRFLSRDPATGNATDPLQLDRYVYAAADPIMQRDPSGLNIGDEYGQLVAQDTSIGAADLPELSTFAQSGLTLFALVVENVTGVALTPAEYAWVAWGLAALEAFQADLAAARALGNAFTSFERFAQNFFQSGAGGGAGASGGGAVAPSPSGSSGGSAGPEDLYHYTPAASVPLIEASGLRASISDPAAPRDATYGGGQYFTDITPQEASTHPMATLSFALYNEPAHWGVTATIGWLEIRVSGLQVRRVAPTYNNEYGVRGIYLNPSTTTLAIGPRLVGTGVVQFA